MIAVTNFIDLPLIQVIVDFLTAAGTLGVEAAIGIGDSEATGVGVGVGVAVGVATGAGAS